MTRHSPLAPQVVDGMPGSYGHVVVEAEAVGSIWLSVVAGWTYQPHTCPCLAMPHLLHHLQLTHISKHILSLLLFLFFLPFFLSSSSFTSPPFSLLPACSTLLSDFPYSSSSSQLFSAFFLIFFHPLLPHLLYHPQHLKNHKNLDPSPPNPFHPLSFPSFLSHLCNKQPMNRTQSWSLV